jgi:riboflavin biosynthesis pyrimidine reductase
MFNRLLPLAGRVDARALLDGYLAGVAGSERRPYTLVNFVASADGRAAVQGRSRAFSDPGDRALFHALREAADAVMAGTGTLAAERYGRMIRDHEARERRRRSGRRPEPLAVTATRSGRLALDIPLFHCAEAEIVVFSGASVALGEVAATVHLETLADHHGPGEPSPLREALRALRERYGVRLLLCEGGPRLFAALLRERLVDELFLTVVPALTGGESGPAITMGEPSPELTAMLLAGLAERDGTLFMRYRLRG